MKQVLVILMIFTTTVVSAQFGVRFKYNSNNYSDWSALMSEFDEEELFPSSWEVGVDYWFKMKNYRIEFYPELAFALSKSEFNRFGELSTTSYMLNFNVNLYPMDLTGDCDCPTFSKQGPGLQKGFFIFMSPGIAYDSYEETLFKGSSPHFNYKIGGGIGLDIGMSDLITITPFVGYNYTFKKTWENFDCALFDLVSDCSMHEDSTLGQIQVGVRVGFRPDYKGFR